MTGGMTDETAGSAPGVLAGYGTQPLDEAVDPAGGVRPAYGSVMEVLDGMGAPEVERRRLRLGQDRLEQGIVFTAQVNGRPERRPFPLDPIPRIVGSASWAHLSSGAIQRARALNAFLDDVYTDARIVADGIVPDAFVRRSPGYLAGARDLAPGGRPRATVCGLDLLTEESGRWVVLEDNLRVPSGLAYSAANRRSSRAALPELHDPQQVSPQPLSADGVGDVLLTALLDAAPPHCPRSTPQVAVLSEGKANSAWYEHRRLAEAMGVPIVTPADLVPDGDGVAAMVDGERIGLDVVYRRLGEDELVENEEAGSGSPSQAAATATHFPQAAELLISAARAGRLSIANAPGNGVGDDKAIYAFVGPMIRYYLSEEPILADVGTWVLADPNQYAAVKGRMGDLVVKPIDGSGGAGVMIGPELTRGQVERLEAVVAAAPHRYIAQEVIHFSTHPTFLDGRLQPRHVDLRVFVISGKDTVVAPVGLSRVALASEGLLVNSSQGGGSKDTWLMGPG
ncbi:circularly permuted type 2 ATP-grasp protein [Nakamurella flavida]